MEIVRYEDKYYDIWEEFVHPSKSINGTFLHSRNFLGYHPKDRFADYSLLFFQEKKLIAVIPACVITENDKKTFFSHKGSTFGGIVLSEDNYNIRDITSVITALNDHLISSNFHNICLKNTNRIFTRISTELIDYLLFYHGYLEYKELSLYIDFDDYNRTDIKSNSNFNKLKRRQKKINAAVKNKLSFRLLNDEEIYMFHELLTKNLEKFHETPIHSLAELIDLKKERLRDVVMFWGCFFEDKLIAASMCFDYHQNCLHTQYLSMDYDYSKLRAMTFLIGNLIQYAMDNNFKKFSFGKTTEENGRILNQSLAEFKENFGCSYTNNLTFHKNL